MLNATSSDEPVRNTQEEPGDVVPPQISPPDPMTEIKKFETEDYKGVILVLIRVPQDDPDVEPTLLFARDCILESQTWAELSKARKGKRSLVGDVIDGPHGEGEEGGMKEERTPINDLVDGKHWVSCKLSRMRPENVDKSNIGWVELEEIDARGAVYCNGPGRFWVWDFNAFSKRDSFFVDEVHFIRAELSPSAIPPHTHGFYIVRDIDTREKTHGWTSLGRQRARQIPATQHQDMWIYLIVP
ncbi:hypothetical protein FRB99_006073 [Tulasnella sp. 403]|nr:hypothetical protein FRB99_006073 [Tulasnella sp. 403]